MLPLILFAYVIGLIICYFIIRAFRENETRYWDDAIITVFLSLLSWLGVFIMLAAVLINAVTESKTFRNRPVPNWLKWL